ncbi:protein kinase, partial [Gemmatimonadota bacterium]
FVFFAMGFVEGESLGERIRERGPVRPAEAARILREVAWALSFAHLQGVVHRDIKPDNILLEAPGGRAMVTDFGIARADESQGLTGVTEILGTAEFMSPEQASGETVDGRSDLYSLGVVGHYMLSGKLPIQGSSVAATLAKQLTQEAPALATVAPEVPKNLSQAMDRCLAKDPEGRFQGGEELADALTSSLAVRRKVPVPLSVFTEQNRESTASITVVGAVAFVSAAVWAWAFLSDGFTIDNLMRVILNTTGILTFFGAVPLGMLSQMARRLLRSGYGREELVLSLRSEVEERRQELASEYGGRSRVSLWASRIAIGGVVTFAAGLASFPLIPIAWWELVGGIAFWAGLTGLGSGLVAGVTHQVGGVVPGERWLKFWEGPLGRGIFKLSKFRLGSVASTGAAYGPTEMALSIAADRLFDKLPKDVQKSFSELPDVVQTLEQDANRMRSRIKELDVLIAQIESEEALGRSGRIAASQGVADKRDSLADDLRNARDAADARLSEVVAALETIRLELLRLHAGAGSVESMTADLTSARELSEDIELLLEEGREVEKLLGSD